MVKGKIIAIDYDGTCTEQNEFPQFGTLRKGLKECLKMLKDNGNTLILWTCRHGDILKLTVNWLREQGIEFDYINENPPYRIEQYTDSRKVGADFYIDDRNIFCKNVDWYEIKKYFEFHE